MHEVSIMESAVSMAVETARKSGSDRVLAVRLRVGVLSGVVPEALRFAFDVVCQGTPAEGAALEMELVPAAAGARCARRTFNSRIFPANAPGAMRRTGNCGAAGNWK